MNNPQLFHVISVNAGTNWETLVTNVPMTHQQCCKFISLFTIDKRRYMSELPIINNGYVLNGELCVVNAMDDIS